MISRTATRAPASARSGVVRRARVCVAVAVASGPYRVHTSVCVVGTPARSRHAVPSSVGAPRPSTPPPRLPARRREIFGATRDEEHQ